MNYELVFRLIGHMLQIEALFMVLPLVVSLIYRGGDVFAFAWAIVITASAGTFLSRLMPSNSRFRTKEAFAAVALSWVFFSFAGALPFYFSGYFESFADCVFESMSGFTATGATVLTEIESLPRGILFWRSLSHWIGGMGVLVFILAVMPSMNASSIHLLKAESTGPSAGKVVPRIHETAKVTYLIYLAMTVALVILLLVSGMPLYDSLIHAFSTSGTGGLSNMNQSMGAYNNATAEIIVTVFMFLFGISFTLYFYLIRGNFKNFFKDEELWFYFGVVIVSILIITVDIRELYGSFPEALRYSSFQVSSIISTAGLITADYDLWPDISRFILLFLMLTGACAGSTGGGIKLIRLLLFFKVARIELNKIIHPRSVKVLMVNGRKADNDLLTRTALYVFIYFAIFFVSVLLISFDDKGLSTNMSAIISMLSNIGPGFGAVGPTRNYSEFSQFSKIILSFCMLAGRLEFIPVLMLFRPSIWKRDDRYTA